jgi:hypothetical protein
MDIKCRIKGIESQLDGKDLEKFQKIRKKEFWSRD